ncbi:hypothetical protein OKA05_22370 [Luteolibacter arcticus]|uniref:Uncharacterized protein n=1 Tax=Luteolibacter arcticus TaxID=1581411 RepID=A0ABT3GP94_9BACT|nr:hypothetical protein [Luteolibacter arcticus]MCW1925322.1 hypothetical protein [Luteolibacter arcticus]
MKRRSAFIFAVILAAAVGLVAWAGPLKSSLPNFDRATMSIFGQREQEEVELSLAQRERLHDLFSGIPRDRIPAKWQVFGTVRLFDEGREVSTVEVFSNSTGGGPFRIGKHYFLGYDQKGFREMLGVQDHSDSSR